MNGPSVIYCIVRKKWVEKTPEEEVRQEIIRHLHIVGGFPLHLMTCEYPVRYLEANCRADLVVHDRNGKPLLIAEFKAPGVPVDEKTVEQLRKYNAQILAPCLLISNGTRTYFWKFDRDERAYKQLGEIPSFEELL
jgi:type I site-specific restriction endonuclease